MHSPTLRVLIDLGHIGGKCVRKIRNGFCNLTVSPENLEAANEILRSDSFRYIHDGYDYDDDLWTLARCSFCEDCEVNCEVQVEQYYKKLLKCLRQELGGSPEDRTSPSRAGGKIPKSFPGYPQSGHDKTKFDDASRNEQVPKKAQSGKGKQQNYKQRRSVRPDQLAEYAKKIKKLELESHGFKQEIQNLARKLQQEQQTNAQYLEQGTMIANEKQLLQIREQQLLKEGSDLWKQHEQLKQQHERMLAQKEAEFNLLMQKFADLERDYAVVQEQKGSSETMYLQDQAKLCGAIKELYANFVQSHGAQNAVWLTPVTQRAIYISG